MSSARGLANCVLSVAQTCVYTYDILLRPPDLLVGQYRQQGAGYASTATLTDALGDIRGVLTTLCATVLRSCRLC